jgi:glycosyltransferase involved in cell wall biosynthesis
MKILFLDQSGKLGGAELSLLDVAKPYRDRSLVGLFADGPFRHALEQQQIPVQILTTESIQVRKDSNLLKSAGSLGSLIPLIWRVAQLARNYDLIYANTQKALVVGAIASWLSRRPLVYHLRDILSTDHFSTANRRIAVTLANRFATLVIANSKATQAAFIEAGGRQDLVEVVYNGFNPDLYQTDAAQRNQIRQQLGLERQFVVGHFSRLSPWKGQHILIEALRYCPEDVTVLLVGDALFGEVEYVQRLHAQVTEQGLENRVKFLGFRTDVVPLMAACDLVAHTSTAPEPFGRVIVEAMLCRQLVVAAEAGGAVELIEPGVTGFLVPPGDAKQLAAVMTTCCNQPDVRGTIVPQAWHHACDRFHLDRMNQQIAQLLNRVVTLGIRC